MHQDLYNVHLFNMHSEEKKFNRISFSRILLGVNQCVFKKRSDQLSYMDLATVVQFKPAR